MTAGVGGDIPTVEEVRELRARFGPIAAEADALESARAAWRKARCS